MIRSHKRIVFNGNGYDEAWIKEAEGRGLLNLRSTPDCVPYYLAQKNIDKVQEIAEKITDICREPLCAEQILGRLFDDYGLAMNFEQYVLVGSTVRSYLAWLLDTGRLLAEFEENMLLWRRA